MKFLVVEPSPLPILIPLGQTPLLILSKIYLGALTKPSSIALLVRGLYTGIPRQVQDPDQK